MDVESSDVNETKVTEAAQPSQDAALSDAEKKLVEEFYRRRRCFISSGGDNFGSDNQDEFDNSMDSCDCYYRYGMDDDMGEVRHIMCNNGW